MANKVIGDYTAAITIDGATHFLLIQPGNSSTAYKKISRNVLLGISSAPLGTTDTQSPTNKTFDNSNIIAVRDDRFTIQDSGDASKQAQFQLSGLTTATTRTYTLPNASSTLADISTTQTFTNKTLTSPTITGGTIDNSTITVDSVAGHTTPNSGTIYGLSITASKVGTNGVITASITDAAVTPAKLVAGTGSTWAWQSWTPTLANITLGTGSSVGKYNQAGDTVTFSWIFTFGASGSAMGTAPTITLPVAPVGMTVNDHVAFGTATDTSAGQPYWVRSVFVSGSTIKIFALGGATGTDGNITSTNPYTWASTDTLQVTGSYRVA